MLEHDNKLFKSLSLFAHGLADASGKAILPYFRQTLAVENKGGSLAFDPVTEADRAAETVLRTLVRDNYPDHGIAGEEFGDTESGQDYCWVLDPIDGTRAFIMGSPLWGTLIGLNYRGAPLIGLMDQPFLRERFWSGMDAAYYRGPCGERKLAARPCSVLSQAILAATTPAMFAAGHERGRFEALARAVRMTRFGGDCYNYGLLAMGFIDVVVEAGLKAYDIAPLIPIIEKAGGVVTAWDGGAAAQGGRVVAAGDPRLHGKVLEVLAG